MFESLRRIFASDGRWAAEVVAAGVLGFLLGGCRFVRLWLRDLQAAIGPVPIGIVIAFSLFVVLAVLVLATADLIRRRLRAGESVGIVARILFGAGLGSVLVWVILTVLVGFPLAIWVGNLTWTHPAG